MLGVRDWGIWKPSLNLRTPIVKEPGREGMGTEGELRVRRQLWGFSIQSLLKLSPQFKPGTNGVPKSPALKKLLCASPTMFR